MKNILRKYFETLSIIGEVDILTIFAGVFLFPFAFPMFLLKYWLFGDE